MSLNIENIETLSSTQKEVERKFVLFTNFQLFLNSMIVIFEIISSMMFICSYFSSDQNNNSDEPNNETSNQFKNTENLFFLLIIFIFDIIKLRFEYDEKFKHYFLNPKMPLKYTLACMTLIIPSIYVPILVLPNSTQYDVTILLLTYMLFPIYALHLLKIPFFFLYCRYYRLKHDVCIPLIQNDV